MWTYRVPRDKKNVTVLKSVMINLSGSFVSLYLQKLIGFSDEIAIDIAK